MPFGPGYEGKMSLYLGECRMKMKRCGFLEASFVSVSVFRDVNPVELSHCFVRVQIRVSLGPNSGCMVLETVHEKEPLSVQAIHRLLAQGGWRSS